MSLKDLITAESLVFVLFWIYLCYYCRGIYGVALKKNRPLSKAVFGWTALGLLASVMMLTVSIIGRGPSSDFLALLAISTRLAWFLFGLIIYLAVRFIFDKPEIYLMPEKQMELSREFDIPVEKIDKIIRRFIDGH